MDLSFKNFSWENFSFESYALLSFTLIAILFLLFEYFPGRNYFYSLNLLKKFIDKHLIPHLIEGAESRKRSWLRMLYISIIWIMLVLALANPRWDFEDVESFRPNVNLLILLDISKSMDAADEKPSRLERAKQEIVDIVKKSEAANIGIIAFANQAHIISPVTDDKNALMYLLPSVNTGLVGVQGSNIEAGLKAADLLLKPMEGGANYVLVISDGGFEEQDLSSMKRLVRNATIITFGVGKTEGAPVPGDDGKFITEDGKMVMTKLEKENLIKISGLENYIQGSYLDDDTSKVIGMISGQMKVMKQKAKLQRIWHDRFYIPLLIAAIMLLPFFRRGAIFPVIIIMFFSTQSLAQEKEEQEDSPAQEVEALIPKEKNWWQKIKTDLFENDDQQAEDLYESRKYKEAKDKFSSAYNRGASSFKDKDYDRAESYFLQERDSNIDSEYNMGNAQLMQNKVKEAIASYESVLKRQPDHEDAKVNLEIAKKLLKNQKNQNNSQNSKQKNDQQKDDKQNDQSGQQDQGRQQDQNKQDQKQGQQNQKDQQDKNQQNGENGEKKDKNEQDQKDGDKQDDSGKKDEAKDGEKPQESDGNNNKKELDIQAKSILSKISSDPEKLMKARFEYEEGKEGGRSSKYKNPKPW